MCNRVDMTRWEYGVLWTTVSSFGHAASVGWTQAGSNAEIIVSVQPVADETASAAHGLTCARAHGVRQSQLGAQGWEMLAIAGAQMHFKRPLSD